MELGNTAGGICAFANDIRRAPHLQQLAIQMSPQWAATIAQAWKAPSARSHWELFGDLAGTNGHGRAMLVNSQQ